MIRSISVGGKSTVYLKNPTHTHAQARTHRDELKETESSKMLCYENYNPLCALVGFLGSKIVYGRNRIMAAGRV